MPERLKLPRYPHLNKRNVFELFNIQNPKAFAEFMQQLPDTVQDRTLRRLYHIAMLNYYDEASDSATQLHELERAFNTLKTGLLNQRLNAADYAMLAQIRRIIAEHGEIQTAF